MDDIVLAFSEQLQNFYEYPMGGLAMLSQILVNVVGLPMQYRQIKKTESINGVSFVMFFLAFISVIFVALHTSFEIMTLFILVPTIPALIFLLLINYQIIKKKLSQSGSGMVEENKNRSVI